MKSGFRSTLASAAFALAFLAPAHGAELCAELLSPHTTTNTATISFVTLLRRYSEKLGNSAPELLKTLENSTGPINPTVGSPKTSGVSEAEAFAFRMAFAKVLRQGDVDWAAVKQAAKILENRKGETQKSAEKARVDTAPVWASVDRSLPKTIPGGAEIVQYESSKGIRYMAGTTVGAKTTTVVNLNSGHSFEIERSDADGSKPAFIELDSGEVQIVASQHYDVVRYSADTGTPAGRISLKDQAEKLLSGLKTASNVAIAEIIPYFPKVGDLSFIVTWNRYADRKGWVVDAFSRIDPKVSKIEVTDLDAESNKFFKSADSTSVYCVSLATTLEGREVRHYNFSIFDISAGKDEIGTETLSTKNRLVQAPGINFGGISRSILSIRFADDVLTYDLRNKTRRSFKTAWVNDNVEQIYEHGSKVFLLLQPSLGDDGGDLEAIDYETGQQIQVAHVAELISGLGTTFLINSKTMGPVLLWTKATQKTYAVELATGESRIVVHSGEPQFSQMVSAFSSSDGTIEIIRSNGEHTSIKQLYGPIPNDEGKK